MSKIIEFTKKFFCLLVFILVAGIIYIKYLNYENTGKTREAYIDNFAKECSDKLRDSDVNQYVQANLILKHLEIDDKYLVQTVDRCIKYK